MNIRVALVLLGAVAFATVVRTVDAADAEPLLVHVSAPLDDDTIAAGAPITFSATATDPHAGDVSDALVWTSSVDGVLGQGGRITRPLAPGIHRITAVVTSADGRGGSSTLMLTAVPSTLEIAPDADTTVDASRPSVALGSARVLHVDGAPEREALLRFSVVGLGSARIERAILRLTVAPGKGAGGRSGGTVRLLEAADDWTEDGTTWGSRPAGDRTLAEAGRVRPGAVLELDVTDGVRGNGVYSFAIAATSSDGVKYRSREALRGQPRLVVTVSADDDVLPRTGTGSGGIRSLAAVSDGVGYEDFSFGTGIDQNDNRVTGAKPESKLWWHDGLWWSTLWQPQVASYRIHWLDPGAQTWVDSGVPIDPRGRSRQDVLLDGGRLYVLSRFADSPPQNRLLRYAYSAGERRWGLDPGFPVDVPGGGTESATIARDSRGTLWTAYTLDAKVFVAHTTGTDAAWSAPFVIPVAEGTTVDADDIAAIQSLPGRIGVFWSNQRTDRFYFASLADGAPPNDAASWQLEVAVAGSRVADDHLNVKVGTDGRLFVAVKTSKTASADTLIGLLVRSANGSWSPLHPVGTVAFNPTRPICVLDEARRRVAVFYSGNHASVDYKESDMDTIAFPSGAGTPFIASASVGDVNNPTTTKQRVNASTGLVVLASSAERNTYWHNGVAPQPPSTTTTTTLTATTVTPTTATTTTSRPSTTTTRAPSTTTRPPTTTTTTPVSSTTTTTRRGVVCVPSVIPGLPPICL
jgi:hypothetical protein